MRFLPFFFGLVVAFFPTLLLLKLFRGRFLVISNAYFAGALYGFWLWALPVLAGYLDLRFGLLGLASSERGVALLALLTTAIRGFLTGGLAAALVWKKAFRR